MKKLLLLLLPCSICYFAHAQLNKGQWLTGGYAGFSHGKNSSTSEVQGYASKTTNLQGQVNAGYFIIDKLCAGLRGGVLVANDDEAAAAYNAQYNYTYAVASSSRNTAWSIGPFVRYYFLKKQSKINILADVNGAYNSNSIKGAQSTAVIGDLSSLPGNVPQNTQSFYKVKGHTISVGAAAGPALLINNTTSLELTVGYTFSKFTAPNLNTGNFFIINAGVQFHLGKKS